MRARHYAAPQPIVLERLRIESRLRPSARDLFPRLRERLLESRPWLGHNKGRRGLEAYGPPTFRNRINAKGEHI